MESCLYEGYVRHRRFADVARTFRYRLFMVYVDLAELDRLFGKRGIWSVRAPAIARFRRSDHLGPRCEPLNVSVRNLVEAQLGWRPQGPIRLLTHFRYFGIGMNPISLFFCFGCDGHSLESVVAEVTNTPWGERHCYVLDFRGQIGQSPKTHQNNKAMHVSPFLPMELDYKWRITIPGNNLQVAIRCHTPHAKAFDALLSLRRRPITRSRLAMTLLTYPLMTTKVITAIYWQALLTWLRGVPFVPHPSQRFGHQNKSTPSVVSKRHA